VTPAHVTETMKFMAGLKRGPLSGRHSPDVATKLSTTDEHDRISGERRLGNSTPPPQAARGGRWEARCGART